MKKEGCDQGGRHKEIVRGKQRCQGAGHKNVSDSWLRAAPSTGTSVSHWMGEWAGRQDRHSRQEGAAKGGERRVTNTEGQSAMVGRPWGAAGHGGGTSKGHVLEKGALGLVGGLQASSSAFWDWLVARANGAAAGSRARGKEDRGWLGCRRRRSQRQGTQRRSKGAGGGTWGAAGWQG